ncbi:ERCC4 domain-containing protein [Thermodesulfobacteriota bacterium]
MSHLIPILAVDSQEPADGGFAPHFSYPWIRKKLDTGDSSICRAEQWVAVERKTTDDLITCFTRERERFVRELQRFQAIPHRWIIVEGSYRDLLRGKYISRMKPKSAWESCVALMVRYAVPCLMVGASSYTGAQLCQSLLLRWVREHHKRISQVEAACREAIKAGVFESHGEGGGRPSAA